MSKMIARKLVLALAAQLLTMCLAAPISAQEELTNWRRGTAPSDIVLAITPISSTVATCADLKFDLTLTNTTSHKITFDQGKILSASSIRLTDVSGAVISPTGKEPSIDSSTAFREVDPRTAVSLGAIEPKYLGAPFSASDCKAGDYFVTISLNLPPGAFLVRSNTVRIRVSGV